MYTFYVIHNKVICVSSYAGKTIKGVAKCAPGDTFDVEIGEELAKRRCDVKVAKARHRRAMKKCQEAERACAEALLHALKMSEYEHDSAEALWYADEELARLEAELTKDE